jgi:hypothetical protein
MNYSTYPQVVLGYRPPITISIEYEHVIFDIYRFPGTKVTSPFKFISSNQRKDILYRYILLGAVAQRTNKGDVPLRVWLSGVALVNENGMLIGYCWLYLSKCANYNVFVLLIYPDLSFDFREHVVHVRDMIPDLTRVVPSDVLTIFEQFHETRRWKEEGVVRKSGVINRKIVQFGTGYVDAPSLLYEPCKELFY